MINVIEKNGVRTLDVETYLNTFQNVKISEDLTLRVGKFTLEDFAKTEAIGQQHQERVKELEENGEKPSQADVFGNLVDQMMAVLKKDNPTLEREQLASLPPAVINGIFKFILKEGMGLEKGHGKDMEAEKTVDTSA